MALCANTRNGGYCEATTRGAKAVATHLVTITSPPDAARVNKPEKLCDLCAAIAAKAYIGFGWGVHADALEVPR